MLRLAGSFFILVGCFGLGVMYRERLRDRIRTLQQLMDILELFEGEIRYGRSVLPECCQRVGEQTKGELGEALLEVGKRMREEEGISFPTLFRSEVGRCLEKHPVTAQDKEFFFGFVSPAGYAEGRMQQRAMEQGRERLSKEKEKLERESAEKSRIAVGLGAMSGFLLILILW